MYRLLLTTALLIPAVARAQPAPPPPPRPMPSYQDSNAQWKGGTSNSYGTADLHHQVDQTPPPPPVPEGYGAYDSAPDEGDDQSQPQADGASNDAAHRADRARTAELNRAPRRGYNGAPSNAPGNYAAEHAHYQAALARHAQDERRYQQDQDRYADRMARWRAQDDACRRGDAAACSTPQ